MKKYLLIITLGPVQSFIAAARRSRDLWSGSWLLSEVSKAVAHHLGKDCLIFPAPADAQDLEPNSPLAVANKIQAIVETDKIGEVAAAAIAAAKSRFSEIAKKTWNNYQDDNLIRQDIWDSQKDDVLEAYAAWAEFTNDYAAALEKANQAIAARKATREFCPAARNANESPFYGLPKSSLDGARETVLPEPAGINIDTRRKLGLSSGEQLDLVGLIKRDADQAEQFTAFSRIVLDHWIGHPESKQADDLTPSELNAISDVYEKLKKINLATGVSGNARIYDALPYDAQLLFRDRIIAAKRENKPKNGDSQETINAKQDATEKLTALETILRPIWKTHGHPCPYGVLLQADGDRMGEALQKLESVEQHRKITQQLCEFAKQVPETLRQHRGHAIYAGGDDVLAFVPLNTAFACAQALRENFADAMQSIAEQLPSDTPKPTLSVGLAIAHFMTPLGDLRALAVSAEKLAKGQRSERNALGIQLAIRAGAPRSLRISWNDQEALADFAHWQAVYRKNELPMGIAHDVEDIAQRTAFARKAKPEIQFSELLRQMKRWRTSQGQKLDEVLQKRIEAAARREVAKDPGKGLANLAEQLIIARWLSARTAADVGESV